jgi:hypothetical protein
MKTITTAFAVAALSAALSFAAHAHAPTVGITAPASGRVFEVSSFPAVVDVSVALLHENNVDSLNLFGAYDATGTLFQLDKAFDNHECTAQVIAITTYCKVAPNSNANVTFEWSVATPGNHSLAVMGRHGSDVGSASIQVTFIEVDIDNPAPPAIANKYIKALDYDLKRGVHGCVISAIAAGHTVEAYGPKGGPYDVDAIHADVDTAIDECSTPTP